MQNAYARALRQLLVTVSIISFGICGLHLHRSISVIRLLYATYMQRIITCSCMLSKSLYTEISSSKYITKIRLLQKVCTSKLRCTCTRASIKLYVWRRTEASQPGARTRSSTHLLLYITTYPIAFRPTRCCPNSPNATGWVVSPLPNPAPVDLAQMRLIIVSVALAPVALAEKCLTKWWQPIFSNPSSQSTRRIFTGIQSGAG